MSLWCGLNPQLTDYESDMLLYMSPLCVLKNLLNQNTYHKIADLPT